MIVSSIIHFHVGEKVSFFADLSSGTQIVAQYLTSWWKPIQRQWAGMATIFVDFLRFDFVLLEALPPLCTS
jgi:hypothetical protein